MFWHLVMPSLEDSAALYICICMYIYQKEIELVILLPIINIYVCTRVCVCLANFGNQC